MSIRLPPTKSIGRWAPESSSQWISCFTSSSLQMTVSTANLITKPFATPRTATLISIIKQILIKGQNWAQTLRAIHARKMQLLWLRFQKHSEGRWQTATARWTTRWRVTCTRTHLLRRLLWRRKPHTLLAICQAISSTLAWTQASQTGRSYWSNLNQVSSHDIVKR